MQRALVNGLPALAAPGLKGTCPCCGGDVLAKCGSILAWHWAHESKDCDPWSEPESYWHLWWKAQFERSRTEVPLGPHRADVVTPRGMVVELQHSSISPEEIWAREHFYRNMVWIFDVRSFADNFNFRRKRDDIYTFRWKHPRKSLWTCSKPVYFDFGGGEVLALRKVYPQVPCGGWGEFIDPDRLIQHLEGR